MHTFFLLKKYFENRNALGTNAAPKFKLFDLIHGAKPKLSIEIKKRAFLVRNYSTAVIKITLPMT
jgi:hypothetical protein